MVVGGNPYRPDYIESLKTLADPRVIFTGAVYGDGYWTLQKGAGAFVSAFEIGGTHPALVEAMAAGNPVLYLNTIEGRETVGDAGLGFERQISDLAAKIRLIVSDPGRRDELAGRARLRAQRQYTWDAVTAQYESLFAELLGPRRAKAAARDC